MAGYCHSWAACPILGTFVIFYVPLIYLRLSGVGFEKTRAAVKDRTQLGLSHRKKSDYDNTIGTQCHYMMNLFKTSLLSIQPTHRSKML